MKHICRAGINTIYPVSFGWRLLVYGYRTLESPKDLRGIELFSNFLGVYKISMVSVLQNFFSNFFFPLEVGGQISCG